MATSEPNSAVTSPRGWLERLANNRQPTAYGLFVVAAAFLGIAIWLGVAYGAILWPVWIWSGGMAATALAGGLWSYLSEGRPDGSTDELRYFILALGGVAGLLTIWLGLTLGYVWWSDILAWLQPGGPDRSAQTDVDRRLATLRAILPLPILLVGLAIMFACLQLARTEERSNAFLRRLLYGYNAALSCLLLLLILVIINIVSGIKLNRPLDFTSDNVFSLSQRSQNILAGLDRPVTFVVVMDRDQAQEATMAMLVACQGVSDKVRVEELSPQINQARIRELAKQYPEIASGGVLILAGNDDSQENRVVKYDDLVGSDMRRRPGEPTKIEFKGEDAIMTELSFLSENRKKPVVYFTQGHGELDLKSRETGRRTTGAGELKSRLEQRNFEVKELKFPPAETAKVPDDANIVVVAGPRRTLPEQAVKALDEYMTVRKGKMMVLLDVVVNEDGTMRPSGLEALLGRFNVQVPGERILSIPNNYTPDPLQTLAMVNSESPNNPLGAAFKDVGFRLFEARPVRVAPPRGMMAPVRAEPLLVVPDELPSWAETNLTTPPSEMVRDLMRNLPALGKKIRASQPLTVAVTVSEGGAPPNPHFPTPPGDSDKPRLVVLGDAAIANNNIMSQRAARTEFAFLVSCLDWLRERKSNIGIPPKIRQSYSLPATTNTWSFLFMPILVICLGIIGLGTGVWVVRRR